MIVNPEFIGEKDSPDGKPLYMTFDCPNRKNERCIIALRPHQKNVVGASWQWDGNKENPTINPSINCEAVCGWHGYITNGKLISC